MTLKTRLEMVLPQNRDIASASANVLTGNVLVLFCPSCSVREVSVLIERVAVEHVRSRGQSVDQETVPRQNRREPAARTRTLPAGLEAPLDTTARPWHVMENGTILDSLGSSPTWGLSAESAETNLKRYGPNTFPEPGARSQLGIFIDQFKSLPVALLGAAAGLSALTGGLADALVIGAVVTINAIIGYLTESEAERTIRALKHLVRPSARVLREGVLREIPAEEVLVGDILELRPGTYVTADARVVGGAHLTLDESSLTGESMPVMKTDESLEAVNVPLGDRSNMVFAGTLVMGGQGSAVVVATGVRTEIGRIQILMVESEPPETPIERQLTTMGNQLVLVSGAVCGLVFAVGVLRGNGVLQMLKTAISLAVAAVPEGLPAVATTTLALGIKNMRRHKVLMRNLEAICTLGSVQTICFDKTGTITLNQMSVLRLFSGDQRVDVSDGWQVAHGDSFDSQATDGVLRLVQIGVLCNETEIFRSNGSLALNGTPTENALVHLAMASGVDVQELRSQYPRIDTHHRSDDRQYMTTIHATGNGGRLVGIKGSPQAVLALCSRQVKNGEIGPLGEEDRERIEAENDSMAGDALRVLGIGFSLQASEGDCDEYNDLTWLGLVGMADPVRGGAKESIRAFHQAGLETVMITGDQSQTAYAVGRELGLNNGNPLEILDSTHLTSAEPEVLRALCKNVHVFARVSPSSKLQIVQALQSAGKVVAMTGDGINDGPALKAADVGIAMGRGGTDVARDVADVILEEDDLDTLTVAISDGRTIYRNIRKTLHYLLATNFSEIQVMFLGGALGIGYPLNAMQLLWINLISDIFPGLALALEPPEPDVMRKDPRDPTEPIVKTEDFKRITFEASTMTVSSLAAYGYGLTRYGMGAHAGTMAFQSLTVSQILHALSCRSETRTVFEGGRSAPNTYLNIAVLGSLGLQLIAQFVPGLRSLLGITPLTALDGLVVGATAVLPLFVNEATKQDVQVSRT